MFAAIEGQASRDKTDVMEITLSYLASLIWRFLEREFVPSGMLLRSSTDGLLYVDLVRVFQRQHRYPSPPFFVDDSLFYHLLKNFKFEIQKSGQWTVD